MHSRYLEIENGFVLVFSFPNAALSQNGQRKIPTVFPLSGSAGPSGREPVPGAVHRQTGACSFSSHFWLPWSWFMNPGFSGWGWGPRGRLPAVGGSLGSAPLGVSWGSPGWWRGGSPPPPAARVLNPSVFFTCPYLVPSLKCKSASV